MTPSSRQATTARRAMRNGESQSQSETFRNRIGMEIGIGSDRIGSSRLRLRLRMRRPLDIKANKRIWVLGMSTRRSRTHSPDRYTICTQISQVYIWYLCMCLYVCVCSNIYIMCLFMQISDAASSSWGNRSAGHRQLTRQHEAKPESKRAEANWGELRRTEANHTEWMRAHMIPVQLRRNKHHMCHQFPSSPFPLSLSLSSIVCVVVLSGECDVLI